jgi:DNA polymerase III epsilon subunit-like protein
MTTAPIVVLDTETCGLDPDAHIWEVAAIRRNPDGEHIEYHAFIQHDTTQATRLPEQFRTDHDARYRPDHAITPASLVDDLRILFAPPADYNLRAHVVGAVPNFDTERIARLMRHHGVDVPWHHHLMDAETLAIGYLRGALAADRQAGLQPLREPFPGPPWDSDALSRTLGIDPDQFERHTALGDCKWALAIYDHVMGIEVGEVL